MTKAMCDLGRLCHLQRSYTRLVLCENDRLDLLKTEWLYELSLGVLTDDHEYTMGDHEDGCVATL